MESQYLTPVFMTSQSDVIFSLTQWIIYSCNFKWKQILPTLHLIGMNMFYHSSEKFTNFIISISIFFITQRFHYGMAEQYDILQICMSESLHCFLYISSRRCWDFSSSELSKIQSNYFTQSNRTLITFQGVQSNIKIKMLGDKH